MYFHYTLYAVMLGVLLDFIVGDPQFIWHPVVGIGKLISLFEQLYRKLCKDTPRGRYIAGILLWISVAIITIIVPGGILVALYSLSKWAYLAGATIMSCQIMATRSLKVHSMRVYQSLTDNNLEKARYDVSMIVGRDTDALGEEGVIKATVETVAENTSDGSIAPLFFLFIGGPVLGFLYKAVNTMDSMVGYKNEKYMELGRFSAKMDDIFNFIPSRIAAVNMIIAAYVLRYNGKGAWRIFKRDRYKSPSPNSAQTESALAGALGVELLGDAVYFGKIHHKETIGDKTRLIEVEDIARANRLLYGTVLISLLIFSGLTIAVMFVLQLLI